jgi:hypothetical protein
MTLHSLRREHFNGHRRNMLRGMISALWVAPLITAARPVRGFAASAKTGGRALTLLYPAIPHPRFDASYYRDHHEKLFMDIYGSAIERFELRTVSAPRTRGFIAMINVWIADFAAFNARSTNAAYDRMDRDKKNFTNIQSSVGLDEVLSAAGEARSAPRVGDTCISLLYRNHAGASWDSEAYCRSYLPMLMDSLGTAAVERIEVRRGLQQLDGGDPSYLGGANIYVRDRAAFARAWAQHGKALDSRSARLSNVEPLRMETTVYGIESAPLRS